ncbi:hypothetical protein EFA46_015515 (plasmid) [Halarchaeum sp. CBA1220]|uniref:hypothetical protein n=1 Tax=Halarchaeum sp. CBA1220 TaxID=1853682 RepID=UPI000F3A9522|nr:hypothetical protein [Halarchaeum sp. CBA1220]QLC35666.1 hypothetical protein EFA46_015515 [Halarchaeum sp. CBA1220]
MTKRAPVQSGASVVIAMLVVAVLVAAGFGYAVGASVLQNAVEQGLVATVGPVSFVLSPINLLLYGLVTVSIGMAVILGVVLVLAKYDTAVPE